MTYSGDLNTQAGQLAIVRDAAALSSAFIVIAQLTGQLPPQSLELTEPYQHLVFFLPTLIRSVQKCSLIEKLLK